MLLAALAGGHWLPAGCAQAAYGVPPPPDHPTIVLTDFSYTPATPIRVGDTLTLTAVTNQPVSDALVLAYFAVPTGGGIELKDDGQPPDAAAGDGIWTAEQAWTAEMGPVEAGAVEASLLFSADYMWQTRSAPPLTVLEEEE